MSADAALARAIAAFRAGRPVQVDGASRMVVLAVETATLEQLALLDPSDSAPLLISGRRAAALSLANERAAADPNAPVLLEHADWLDAASAMALVDAGLDGARAPIGPLKPIEAEPGAPLPAVLRLARLAGLLPAAWILPAQDTQVRVSAEAILAGSEQAQLVARASLPLEDVEDAQIAVFRAADGTEHPALVVGAFGGRPPLVRLHSECLTGDVFGSLKCDCGPQLREALRLIAAEGGGVLLYLRQEGRGIGLANKIRAYGLQDRGFDTVEANERLGFADDERGFEIAAAILKELGISQVRLLTNNPRKVEGLGLAGCQVVERVGHHMPVNPHNADYIETKRAKSGHLA